VTTATSFKMVLCGKMQPGVRGATSTAMYFNLFDLQAVLKFPCWKHRPLHQWN